MARTTFNCPKCGLRIEAIAVAAGHLCPANRSKWVDFVPVLSTEKERSNR